MIFVVESVLIVILCPSLQTFNIPYDLTKFFVIYSECKRCIAQLLASVSVLLHSLERVGPAPDTMGGYFSWKVDEGVKCACFLRRIYEEV